MGLTLVTAPTNDPVTVDELRAHARIDHTEEVAELTMARDAAVQHVEHVTGRQLCSATWRYSTWPVDVSVGSLIRLPKGQLQSVTSVQVRNADGTYTTISPEAYELVNDVEPGYVLITSAWAMPGNWPDAIRITFVAGYGLPSQVPASLRRTILAIASSLYSHREAEVTERALIELGWINKSLWAYKLAEVPG